MNPIHEIYCTHCTYGTSALDRRREQPDEVAGYTARASTFPFASREELRKWLSVVESQTGLLSYELPKGTPREENLVLTASTAPRRLIYYPEIGSPNDRLRVLGQICHRQTDTSRDRRPGSYFGHLLVNRIPQGAAVREQRNSDWSVIECLQSWGSPRWVLEDSEDIPHDLVGEGRPLTELKAFCDGQPPWINDDLLLDFLTAQQGQAFITDAGQVIDERWTQVEPQQRAALLVEVLRAYLSCYGTNRRVLLVVEPGVAALLFYGIARLLADAEIREKISFSTFEPQFARTYVALAATMFHEPMKGRSLLAEIQGRNWFIWNTFEALPQAARRNDYAELVVGTLVNQGWGETNRLIEAFESSGPRGAEDLESLATSHQALLRLFAGGPEKVRDVWKTKVARKYVVQRVEQHFADLPPDAAQFAALADLDRQMLVMDLVAGNSSERLRSLRDHLLRLLPPHLVLQPTKLTLSEKADAVARSIERHQAFPANCEAAWNMPAGKGEWLLPAILARLSKATLESMFSVVDSVSPRSAPPVQKLRVPTASLPTFLLALAQACSRTRAHRRGVELLQVLDQFLRDCPVEFFCSYLSEHQAEFLPLYPQPMQKLGQPMPETGLNWRLQRLLEELPQDPAKFEERLALLCVCRSHLPGDADDAVAHWELIRGLLHKVHASSGEKSGSLVKLHWKKKPVQETPDDLDETLVRELNLVMPSDEFNAERRYRFLENAGRAMTGHNPFFQGFLAKRVRNRLENKWSETGIPVKLQIHGRSKSRGDKLTGFLIGILSVGVVAGGTMIAAQLFRADRVAMSRSKQGQEPPATPAAAANEVRRGSQAASPNPADNLAKTPAPSVVSAPSSTPGKPAGPPAQAGRGSGEQGNQTQPPSAGSPPAQAKATPGNENSPGTKPTAGKPKSTASGDPAAKKTPGPQTQGKPAAAAAKTSPAAPAFQKPERKTLPSASYPIAGSWPWNLPDANAKAKVPGLTSPQEPHVKIDLKNYLKQTKGRLNLRGLQIVNGWLPPDQQMVIGKERSSLEEQILRRQDEGEEIARFWLAGSVLHAKVGNLKARSPGDCVSHLGALVVEVVSDKGSWVATLYENSRRIPLLPFKVDPRDADRLVAEVRLDEAGIGFPICQFELSVLRGDVLWDDGKTTYQFGEDLQDAGGFFVDKLADRFQSPVHVTFTYDRRERVYRFGLVVAGLSDTGSQEIEEKQDKLNTVRSLIMQVDGGVTGITKLMQDEALKRLEQELKRSPGGDTGALLRQAKGHCAKLESEIKQLKKSAQGSGHKERIREGLRHVGAISAVLYHTVEDRILVKDVFIGQQR